MSDLLYNTKLDILYMDTDSIFLTSRLPNDIISKDIGKWKLEYILKKAIFLAPKCFSIIISRKNITIDIRLSVRISAWLKYICN